MRAKGVPRLLIVDPNHDATTQDRPTPFFRDFVETRYTPAVLAFMRPVARKVYSFIWSASQNGSGVRPKTGPSR
jgi:hypothetical protein